MPKITDRAFESVFQNLEIKQFILTGKQPLKSVIKNNFKLDIFYFCLEFAYSGFKLYLCFFHCYRSLQLELRVCLMDNLTDQWKDFRLMAGHWMGFRRRLLTS